MRIKLTSIMVDDQDNAERFYTEILGFRKKLDFPLGDYRWLTVVSPDGPDDLELVLEPNANPAGEAYQQAMFSRGIPIAMFESRDIDVEFARLSSLGVQFIQAPVALGAVKIAVFADTCGNFIQLYQPAA